MLVNKPRLGLVFFKEQKVLYNKDIHVGPHKAMVGLLGCTDDRFSTNVKARVDHDWASRCALKGLNQFIETRVVFSIGI